MLCEKPYSLKKNPKNKKINQQQQQRSMIPIHTKAEPTKEGRKLLLPCASPVLVTTKSISTSN